MSLMDLLLMVLIADAAQNAMVNEYKSLTEGLVLCGTLIGELTENERKKVVRVAVKEASQLLGNTIATVRKYYIHPKLLESFEKGDFAKHFSRFKLGHRQGFTRDEQLLAHFL